MSGYHDKAPAGDCIQSNAHGVNNYEDSKEIKCKPIAKQPIFARKRVTWKSEVTTPFRAPQDCVRQNRILAKKPRTDRQIGRTRCTCGNTGHKASTALGTARLVRRS